MIKEEREKADRELHAPGKPTRVMVPTKSGSLHETISGQFRVFHPGEVFEHPAPKRAEQLIALGLVVKTDEPTAAEKEISREEENLAIEELMEQQRDKARKLLTARKEKLSSLEAKLLKMTDEILGAELKARKLEGVDENKPAKIKAILADELEKIKAAE